MKADVAPRRGSAALVGVTLSPKRAIGTLSRAMVALKRAMIAFKRESAALWEAMQSLVRAIVALFRAVAALPEAVAARGAGRVSLLRGRAAGEVVPPAGFSECVYSGSVRRPISSVLTRREPVTPAGEVTRTQYSPGSTAIARVPPAVPIPLPPQQVGRAAGGARHVQRALGLRPLRGYREEPRLPDRHPDDLAVPFVGPLRAHDRGIDGQGDRRPGCGGGGATAGVLGRGRRGAKDGGEDRGMEERGNGRGVLLDGHSSPFQAGRPSSNHCLVAVSADRRRGRTLPPPERELTDRSAGLAALL